MEAGLTVKPVGAAPASGARSGARPVRAAVATELAPSQSVTAARDGTRGAGHEPVRDALVHAAARGLLLDPQTREVIYRAMSGRADKARPQEARLKLQAYRRAEPGKDDGERGSLEKTA